MSLTSLIAKQIPRLVKKGLGKGEIRNRIAAMPQFADNQVSFFKPRKGSGSDYGGTFDRAWKSLDLPAVDPRVSGKAAGEKIRDPITGKMIRGASEETKLKQSQSQLNLINESIRTGIPSKNPTIRRIVDAHNMGFSKRGTNTYTKAQEKFASEYGGSLKNLRGDPAFQQAWHTRRTEAQAVYNNLMGKPTPAKKILDKYGKDPGWEDIVKARQDWTDVITPGRKIFDEQLSDEFIKQGVTGLGKFSAQNPYLGGIAHQLGIHKTMQLYKNLTPRNMKTKEMIQMINDPANIGVEYNFMNPSMGSLQGVFSALKPGQLNKLGQLPRMLKDAQVGLKYFDDEGILQAIGKKGRELDPEQMRRYMQYIANELPFGVTKSGRPRYLPIKTKKYIEGLMSGDLPWNFNKGGVVKGYAAGGIADIAAKILPKLAKRLSDKELKLVMETLWRGVDPKKSGRYRVWDKNRWGPGYKWPYEKSRIKGPEIKKSHFANLSPGERVELQSKYADQLWEYQMKKKLKMPMDEDLPYPFLSPDNKAFISTSPRTGLGRYQMRHSVDPENVGPISKYAVYDWWDDILKQMRKKPKFKYVKDDKGNTIMKRVK